MKVNLGCGPDIRQGWVNLDLTPLSPEVQQCDFENASLPLEDESADWLEAIDLLEHIYNLIPFLHECYRVLKPGGTFYIEVPKFPSNAAVADPTHVRFFVEETFQYLTNYEGARKMYHIDPWKLTELSTTDNRIFARLTK